MIMNPMKIREQKHYNAIFSHLSSGGRLAQLDSAPVYGTGGCVFESRGDR